MMVFHVAELRAYIFSFLRKKAYVSCDVCGRVCQWDVCGSLLLPTMTYGGQTLCRYCFMEQRWEEMQREQSMMVSEYL